jgi:hypothetical protein
MIWDDFSQPARGQLFLKLANTATYGNWSWAKDSDGKVGIALELSKKINSADLASSNYFEINTKSVPLIGNVLTVFCTSSEFYEIFEVLCVDLIKSALNAQTEIEAISILSNRIHIWTKLFSRGFKGLSVQQVLGLAAELSFLKKWVTQPILGNITAWTGPLGTPQDFTDSVKNMAFEVKAIGRSDLTVKISSLDQLDFGGQLFLVTFPVVSAKIDDPVKINLDQLVAEITELLSGLHIPEFLHLLLQAGYVTDLYKDIKFTVGDPYFYKLGPEFPRIIRASVPQEVIAVRYEIDLAQCKKFEVENHEFLSLLK